MKHPHHNTQYHTYIHAYRDIHTITPTHRKHIHTHTQTHLYKHMHIHTYASTPPHTYTYTHMHNYTHAKDMSRACRQFMPKAIP